MGLGSGNSQGRSSPHGGFTGLRGNFISDSDSPPGGTLCFLPRSLFLRWRTRCWIEAGSDCAAFPPEDILRGEIWLRQLLFLPRCGRCALPGGRLSSDTVPSPSADDLVDSRRAFSHGDRYSKPLSRIYEDVLQKV